MGRRHYALERGGPRRLHLRWGFWYRRFRVALDDGPEWTIDRASLLRGVPLVLPDGSSLFVRYVRRPWYSVGLRNELRVERDGLPLPGSEGDPRRIGRRAGALLLFLAAVRGVILVAVSPGELASPAFLAGEAALVLLLGVLAVLGLRLAVLLAAVLFLAEIPLFPGALVLQALLAAHLLYAWVRMRPRRRVPNLREIFE
jgi:hypothetical protein